MSNENLQGKLRAIQTLKTEKYIGTQEAWNHLESLAQIYDIPNNVSISINESLSKRHSTLHYPATPERVLAFYTYLDELFEESVEQINGIYNDSLFSTALHWNILGFDLVPASFIQESVNHAIPFFNSTQSPNTADEDFAINSYQEIFGNLQLTEEGRMNIYSTISSSDWNSAFSKKNMIKKQREIESDVINTGIGLAKRLKRLERDRLDHRLEYRRELLTDWLTVITTPEGINDYHGAVSLLDAKIIGARRNLKSMESLKAPISITQGFKDILHLNEFLRTCIAPEKNFINRFLNS